MVSPCFAGMKTYTTHKQHSRLIKTLGVGEARLVLMDGFAIDVMHLKLHTVRCDGVQCTSAMPHKHFWNVTILRQALVRGHDSQIYHCSWCHLRRVSFKTGYGRILAAPPPKRALVQVGVTWRHAMKPCCHKQLTHSKTVINHPHGLVSHHQALQFFLRGGWGRWGLGLTELWVSLDISLGILYCSPSEMEPIEVEECRVDLRASLVELWNCWNLCFWIVSLN